jgi:hypothetical protein
MLSIIFTPSACVVLVSRYMKYFCIFRRCANINSGSEVTKSGRHGLDVTATLTVVGEGLYRLELEGLNDYSSKDHLSAAEFLPVLSNRCKSSHQQMEIFPRVLII